MKTYPDVMALATGLRVIANVSTVGAAFAWLRFADVRDGCLDRPNVHHRVYLRVLITASVVSAIASVAAVAVTIAGAAR